MFDLQQAFISEHSKKHPWFQAGCAVCDAIKNNKDLIITLDSKGDIPFHIAYLDGIPEVKQWVMDYWCSQGEKQPDFSEAPSYATPVVP
jgi:hypothetical protein